MENGSYHNLILDMEIGSVAVAFAAVTGDKEILWTRYFLWWHFQKSSSRRPYLIAGGIGHCTQAIPLPNG